MNSGTLFMTKTFWNGYASDFDAIYGTNKSLLNNLINGLFRKSMKVRFEKIIEEIPQDASSVIDIGCGAGHYSIALAKKGVTNIHGIDFSENMIELGIKHAMENGVESRVIFEEEDFEKFKSERKYDYSIMMGFIEYFQNPELILKKAFGITNKMLYISFPEKKGLLAMQRKIRYRKKCFLRLYNKNDIEKLLKSISIENYKIEKIYRDYFVSIQVS